MAGSRCYGFRAVVGGRLILRTGVRPISNPPRKGVALLIVAVGFWERNLPELKVMHVVVCFQRIRDVDEMVFIDPS